MLRQMYECKCCDRTFKSETECIDHEESCKGRLVIFKCGRCGKISTYYESKKINYPEEVKKNCCHILKVDMPGHGSKFERKKVEIPCCDECLEKIVESSSQEVQDLIYDEEDIYVE